VIEAVAADLPSHAVNVAGLDLESLEETIRSAVKHVVKESIQQATGGEPGPP